MSVVRHAVFTSNQGLLRSQNTQTRDPLCRFSVPLLLRPQLVGVTSTPLSPHVQKRLRKEAVQIEIRQSKPLHITTMALAGQISMFPELERPITRLADFTAGILSPSASLELEHRRKRLGLSQRQLGKIAGLSQPHIANAVHGQFGLSRHSANRIKAALFPMERIAA